MEKNVENKVDVVQEKRFVNWFTSFQLFLICPTKDAQTKTLKQTLGMKSQVLWILFLMVCAIFLKLFKLSATA